MAKATAKGLRRSVGWMVLFAEGPTMTPMWSTLCPTQRQAWREASGGDEKELAAMKEDDCYKAVRVKVLLV